LIPQAPSYLEGLALERWQTIWNEVDRTRVTMRHSDSVALYCQAWATFTEACRAINRDGATYLRDNRPVTSPYVAIRDNTMRTLMELGRMLGLTPDVVLAPVSRWDDYTETIEGDSDNGILGQTSWAADILDRRKSSNGADSSTGNAERSGANLIEDLRATVLPSRCDAGDNEESTAQADSGNMP